MPSSFPFTFSSKADTLQALSAHDELHIPCPCLALTVEQWNASPETALRDLRASFSLLRETRVAVRSSCCREDSQESSAAGAYLSILNVPLDDTEALREAINKVFASYGEALPEDQVLVQPMIRERAVTGVIMTRVLSDGAPYYVYQLR